MFMEHTDKIRFTREDSALLEKYFDMVGQRPVKVDLILGGRSGHALANGVIFLFPGVDLSRATSEGIYADFISMFDPEDMGTLIFCQDEREYMSVIDRQICWQDLQHLLPRGLAILRPREHQSWVVVVDSGRCDSYNSK